MFQSNKKDGELYGAKSAKQLTDDIITHLEDNEFFEVKNLSVTGPGFINIFIKEEYINNEINRLWRSELIKPSRNEKVVID